MISIETAFQLLTAYVVPFMPANVKLRHSAGRLLAKDIAADVDSPPHRKSVMDGYAVRSEDLRNGLRKLKVVETIVAGSSPQCALQVGETARIMTGAPLPDGADAVVMVEQTTAGSSNGSETVFIEAESVSAGKHMMEKAANFATGETVFQAGHRIRPSDIGLLAEVGAHQVSVGSLPTAAFLPTGDELVECDSQPKIGQIRNSNGPMLLGLANCLGLQTTDLGIGRDNPSELQAAIQKGLEHDLLVLSGGVSAGTLDLVPGILKNEGVEQVFHKVKLKPGKPIWFGVLDRDGRRKYVFGLPGNPVSSLVGFHLFVRTAIRLMEGEIQPQPQAVKARLAVSHETRGDRPTYWPGQWVSDESSTRTVKPLIWHGPSDLLALGLADGLICFPDASATHPAGEQVDFFPLYSGFNAPS